jgi:hypothetical protein
MIAMRKNRACDAFQPRNGTNTGVNSLTGVITRYVSLVRAIRTRLGVRF